MNEENNIEKENTELDTIKLELKEQKDFFLRALAESENKIKIAQKDAQNAKNKGIERLIIDFISILDDLKQAKENLPEEKGIDLILQNFQKILNNNQVTQLETNIGDKFDPNLHQAISSEKQENTEIDLIIKVLQAGYKHKEKIIKPSIVITSC